MKDIKIKVLAGRDASTIEYILHNLPELKKEFNFINCEDPDYVIEYTKKGPTTGKFKNILWAEEWLVPNLSKWDWVLGWQYEDQINSVKYIRFTNYFILGAGLDLIKKDYDPEKVAAKKTKFCNYVYYHYVPERDDFMRELSKYKQVDSPGVCCTNCPPIGGHDTIIASRNHDDIWWKEKIEWLQPYKFTIAIENRNISGYTSEKIYHAMLANSIPIYWGNPDIGREFNTNSFINLEGCKYKHPKDVTKYLVDRVIDIDTHTDKYLKMLKEPWLPNNKLTPWIDKERYLNFFRRIFS